ncbi:MAG: formylglycine-generating enzyme family protein [Phycisphaera sp.]|nr:MAG: formylglycine-generating enzyme family protein [Phycisphaera sp.]
MPSTTRSAFTTRTLALALAAAPALSQTIPPDYGHDFVTIGAPGNRGVLPSEAPDWNFDRFGTYGGVDYEYRITRTEVTNDQYIRFAQSYLRAGGATTGGTLIGHGIRVVGFDPDGVAILDFLSPGSQHAPAIMSWRYAARYTNWLHNGQGTDLEDFNSGVYDASTFRTDPVTGAFLDQPERSPDAKYFLPTLDEWTKAVHYDPDRYGDGQEGYWYHPGGSDDFLVSGPPGTPGAETSGGESGPPGLLWYPVGSYPDTTTPWGLLDASGGVEEMLETAVNPSTSAMRRLLAGSGTVPDPTYQVADRLDSFGSVSLPGLARGFRVASVVTAPCPPDLDGDGELTIFDFLAFQTLFDAMDPAVDFDGDGAFTILDFLAFQNAFDAGCA